MFTDAELLAFIDEQLPADRSSRLETALRTDESLRTRLSDLANDQIAGMHSVSAIWRRARLSCPTREQLGHHLLGALPSDQSDYINFHLDVIGCRYCTANRDDLANAAADTHPSQPRRRKYFQTSAGHLTK